VSREPDAVISYPRDAVVTIDQLAAALQVSVRVAEKMDLPTVYIGPRLKRFVWGQVLDTLTERAA
jgi:hypothetical protein